MKSLKATILMLCLTLGYALIISLYLIYNGVAHDYQGLVLGGAFLFIFTLVMAIYAMSLFRNRMPPDLAKAFHGEDFE